MVCANVKIVEELKLFLDTIIEDKELKSLITNKKGDFSRNRKLTIQSIIGFIINMPKRSLSVELHEFFEHLDTKKAQCTKGAFSLQRTKLSPVLFKAWNKWLVDCFYHYYGSKAKSWRGFLVQAVDGSTAYLFNKPEVVSHYGTQYNQYKSIPLARIMQVHDVLNDITVWGDIFPIARSEQSIMADRVSHLRENSITLFDRAYPSFSLMYLMLNEETPRHFVMRCKLGFNREVIRFLKSGKSSKIVHLTPDRNAIAMLREHGYKVTRETQIKVRMVKITLPGGVQEVLLTSLYNSWSYTIKDLYYLYGLRWAIETTYGKQKNQQQIEQFSGHRVICIEQDYAASLFVANLQSLIEKQCTGYLKEISAKRKYNYKINRNVSWAALKHNIVKLFLENNVRQILIQLQKIFERNTEPIRPGRKYPRTIKMKKNNGKYQTFTNYKRAV